ncbi:MAG: hypothetical protein ACLT8E_11785 [Akkermansia sp.]
MGWFEAWASFGSAARKLRTDYDLELIEELGILQGLKLFRHLSGRLPGSSPSHAGFLPQGFLT